MSRACDFENCGCEDVRLTNGRTNERTDGGTDGRTDRQRTDRQRDERTDRGTNGRTDGRTRYSRESDGGDDVELEDAEDEDRIAVREDVSVLEHQGQHHHSDAHLDEGSDEPGTPVDRVTQTHHLHHLSKTSSLLLWKSL